MSVKEKFHKLIESIKDDEMLSAYYDLVSQLKNQENGTLYHQLSDQQKMELDLAYNESFISSKMLSHEEVKSEHKKWL